MKIGFIVQKDWKSVHYGVRNYFTTIASVIEEENLVDYLIHDSNDNSEGMWYLYSDREYGDETKKTSIIEVEGVFSYSKYSEIKNKIQETHSGNEKYYRCIGNTLYEEKYDILVVTNPWLIDFNEKLPAKKVIGIVYDLIANEYALTGVTADFEWAYLHNRGYQYYLNYCDEIYAISEKITKEFNRFYHTGKCITLNPFPPYVYREVQYVEGKKENAVVLAAPFDLRKGIENIPKLLNPINDVVETLYIYGNPRCEIAVFDRFFEKMKIEKIVYFPYITPEDLIKLYMRCKVLLFPSLEEGLGIPLIEAQICGCRVVTSDKEPMNKLALEGSYLLKQADSITKIKEMLIDDKFDYKGLSEKAIEYFSLDTIKNSFIEGC